MTTQTFVKDPDAVLDFSVDWTSWLNTSPEDTISTSTWVAEDGITIDSEGETTKKATVWLSGGTAGQKYDLTNSIVTTAGREEDRTIRIIVKER